MTSEPINNLYCLKSNNDNQEDYIINTSHDKSIKMNQIKEDKFVYQFEFGGHSEWF